VVTFILRRVEARGCTAQNMIGENETGGGVGIIINSLQIQCQSNRTVFLSLSNTVVINNTFNVVLQHV